MYDVLAGKSQSLVSLISGQNTSQTGTASSQGSAINAGIAGIFAGLGLSSPSNSSTSSSSNGNLPVLQLQKPTTPTSSGTGIIGV